MYVSHLKYEKNFVGKMFPFIYIKVKRSYNFCPQFLCWLILTRIEEFITFAYMKPLSIRQRPLEIFIHFIIWLLVFGFPLVMANRESSINWEQYLRHSIVSFSYFIVFYCNYLWLIPRLLFKNRILQFCLSNLILISLLNGMTLWGISQLSTPPPHRMPHMVNHPPRWLFFLKDLIAISSVIVLSIAIRVSMQWRKTEEKLIKAEQEKADAELKNLKNQLNPHFLLNTLNNIYALIAFDGQKAQEAVHELSKLLRYMLYDNQNAYVPLEKELDFINNYVSLMRIRVVKSVEVSLNLDEGSKPLLISPLIFISLIENAFKHGISPTENSFISISIHGHEDGKVCCEIMNSNFPKNNTDKSGSGIGLEQVKRRLELIYPERHEWYSGVNEDGSTYTSLLTIQTNEL